MTEAPARGVAYARAALAGNPSDGYGGAVLAVTLDQHRAEAEARQAHRFVTEPQSRLVEATARRFARELLPEALGSEVRWRTSIPRGVGLGGSSAIVIAVLRALCGLHDVKLERDALARFALDVETEELDIAAGLQDRVTQSYGGLVFMDFARSSYERLDSGLLPPFVVAWRTGTARDSGEAHRELRWRFDRGAPELEEAMARLGRLAHEARSALARRDREAFAQAVDGSFDVRQRMMPLDPRHVEMVACARALGAAANYTGSGGAVVAVCRDDRHRQAVTRGLLELQCEVIRGLRGVSSGQDPWPLRRTKGQ
jgi:glucuronokinase